MESSLYPKLTRDLLLEPERYSFPDVSQPNYFDLYLSCREQAIRAYSESDFTTVIRTSNAENITNSSLYSAAEITHHVRMFEVRKRFSDIATDQDYIDNALQFMLLARSIYCYMKEQGVNFQWVSTLLKLGDVLCSLSKVHLLSAAEKSQIASHLSDECKLLNSIAAGVEHV